jgi:nucleoside 2-deoxyribosyltransferase
VRRVYVASPLGFTEAGREFVANRLLPALAGAGFTPIDPFALEPAAGATIGETNVRALDGADVVLAVLDGPDVDSGTAAEIGYAFARDKPIVGYRSDLRRAGEHDGVVVNLQVEHFIRASGGSVVDRLDDVPAALARVRSS